MTKQIPLTHGQFSLIDDQDFDNVSKYNWHLTSEGYARFTCRIKGTKKHSYGLMHNIIMNPPEGFIVDHHNGNKLDNRRQNLRICTRKQNSYNRKKRVDSSSPFKGVHARKDRWRATIMASGKSYNLGTFPCPIEAAKAYNEAALKYHGDFAYLNPI